uniref:Uncharacterized protein n=1 Tax=Panagrellus redivivus TaxID=6233 RepID=A0A7E4VNB8_PANRE
MVRVVGAGWKRKNEEGNPAMNGPAPLAGGSCFDDEDIDDPKKTRSMTKRRRNGYNQSLAPHRGKKVKTMAHWGETSERSLFVETDKAMEFGFFD